MPLNAAEIQTKLGYQAPLALLDQVTRLVPDEQIIGQKSVSNNEFFFQGHFPHNPVMPGVLLIETMVEAAKLMWEQPNLTLIKVKRGRFREMIRPGMQLTIKVIAKEKYGCQAEVLVADKEACTADLEFKVKE